MPGEIGAAIGLTSSNFTVIAARSSVEIGTRLAVHGGCSKFTVDTTVT
jgi:hypothetical protein